MEAAANINPVDAILDQATFGTYSSAKQLYTHTKESVFSYAAGKVIGGKAAEATVVAVTEGSSKILGGIKAVKAPEVKLDLPGGPKKGALQTPGRW